MRPHTIKYLLIGLLWVADAKGALAHNDSCFNSNHKVPTQAKVGAGAEEINSYWCRHSSLNSDYTCTIYSPKGMIVSEGQYKLYKIPQYEEADLERKAQFDAGKFRYDSGGIGEIFLDTISPELSFRADGNVAACQVGGNEIDFQFSKGKITELRLASDLPKIKVIQSDK